MDKSAICLCVLGAGLSIGNLLSGCINVGYGLYLLSLSQRHQGQPLILMGELAQILSLPSLSYK